VNPVVPDPRKEDMRTTSLPTFVAQAPATHFVLISRFHIAAEPMVVWRALTQVSDWQQWWPAVAAVERPDAAHEQGSVGAVAFIDWKSPLGYRFRVKATTLHVDRPRSIEARVEGDLHGHGLWVLEPQERGVDVTYRWDLELRRPWMRRWAWLLRPLFAWSHFRVVRSGVAGLARHLDAPAQMTAEWVGGPR
jgi:uncharacterized protein YndB with AHSA1/START domain